MTYQLPIRETFESAWEKTKGSKSIFWIALGIIFIISLIIGVISYYAKGTDGVEIAINSIGGIIKSLLLLGVTYIGIQRALDLPIHYQFIFKMFNLSMFLRIISLYILQSIIYGMIALIGVAAYTVYHSHIPFSLVISILLYFLCAIIGLYVGIRMCLAIAFILDKKCGPWNAIVKSFEATEENFFTLLFFIIIQIAILAISAIPLLIGLIWSIPFLYISYGVLYQKLSVNVRP